MIVTQRFLLLALLGVFPLALSGLFPPLADLTLVWNVVLALCALSDFLRTPRPDAALSAQRTADEALSVAASNDVALRVRNQTPGFVNVLVRDEPPPEFDIVAPGARQESVRLAPFTSHDLRYTVVPPARGDFFSATCTRGSPARSV
jgi:uncharacterized protein (DUF58 family)